MNNEARQEILGDSHALAASAPFDARESPVDHPVVLPAQPVASNLIELFKQNLEAVDGHCIIAHSKR